MENQTIALLRECDAGCKMAAESMNQVQKSVDDPRLGALIADYRGKHEKLRERISSLLKAAGGGEKEPPMMASAFSWASTEMKLLFHEDRKQIAKIMMDGCNMGIQSVSGYINQYSGASPDSLTAARDLVRTEEEFMKELKKFL